MTVKGFKKVMSDHGRCGITRERPCVVTNLLATTKGWRGQYAYIDAAHRVHARVEDVIRTGKDTSLGHSHRMITG